MIPLYPPRQGDPSLRLVKWRSLVQLVHHSHDSDEAPRARSHSTIVFLPNSRKHSSTSQFNVRKKSESAVTDKRPSSLERQRRPSAPSLGDLKRFLPNLIHRSRSSANIEEDGVELLAGGSGSGVESVPEHQAASSSHSTSSPHLQSHQQQRPDSASGAKNKVQRLKAAATNPPSLAKETVAAQQQQQSNSRPNFFFKKQGRKPIVVEQSTLVVSGSTTVVHGPLALTTNRPLIDSGNAQKPSALDQNTVIKKVSVVESAEEDPVVVVVDPSLLLANKSAAKGAQLNPNRTQETTPNCFTSRKQSSLVTNGTQSEPQKTDKYSAADQCFPSKKTLCSTSNSHCKNSKSPRNSGELTHALTTPLICSFHSQNYQLNSSLLHPPVFYLSKSQLNHTRLYGLQRSLTYPPTKTSQKRQNSGQFKGSYKHTAAQQHDFQQTHHNFSFAQEANQQNAELFGRRHSLPDMAIAAYGMVICGGSDELQHKYRGRIEKVKFGVPITEAFTHDIPATLLVLLLKINKEGPLKKDIWRAPGNQSQVRKLSHIMQHGRLVNISHISVYTSASVIKKFLSKLPGGIFGPENEHLLFNSMQNTNAEQQRQVFCRVICSLSLPSQHLLVLLFGTFRIIADSAETFNTRMTPDAIGISVAPSLFHTCMQDEQRAKLEDVMRFKLASQVISKIIQSFGYTNLFPRECYEFYARITGRTLRVDESWHFSFAYPSRTFSQPSICFGKHAGEAEEEEQQPGPSGFQAMPSEQRRRSDEGEDDDIYSEELQGPSRSHRQRDRAASASGASSEQKFHHGGYWRHRDPFSDLMDQKQLSTSMGEVLLHSEYERAIGESLSDRPSGQPSPNTQTMSSRCAESLESTRSLTYLEWVHEKQTRRMRTRSEWFLSPVMPSKNNGASKSFDFHAHLHHSPSPLHQQQRLKLPETDEEMSLQSSNEEMRTTSSHSSSIKEQRPVSPIQIAESALEPMVRKVEEMVVLSGETTPRLPFQLLQHHSGDDDDAPLSATPPARQQPPVFFGDDAPPPKTAKSSSSSSGSHSQKSILVGPSSTAPSTQEQPSGLTRVSSIGVVRRKSWRTHYVRPNKSLDQESAPKEELGPTSHSTPAASTRRSSANGDNGKNSASETSRGALIRRKSSNSTTQSSKLPVQTRHSLL